MSTISGAGFAIVIPLANEEKNFRPFIERLKEGMSSFESVKTYLVTDKASSDNTSHLCADLEKEDARFIHVFAPENKNVVDAYISGFREAVKNNHAFIIEMDAGLSHDPMQLKQFAEKLLMQYDCVWGSRYVNTEAENRSHFKRRFISRLGTVFSNLLLGTKLKDMTSGYQGFTHDVAKQIVSYPLRSKAHFYQTEIRYLLRNKKQIEIPVQYRSPSPRISIYSLQNAAKVLLYYFICRISGNAKSIR